MPDALPDALPDARPDARPDAGAATRGRAQPRGGSAPGATPDARQLPLWRLHVLRLGYLLMGVGLAVVKWPLLFQREQPWELMEGVVTCMLVALSVLALVGLRYPLQMLPVLLFESAWKLLWLAVVALPLLVTGQLDPATRAMASDLLWVAPILLVIPWPYVVTHYVSQRGDRWRPGSAAPPGRTRRPGR